jgi:hypothetical protein
MRIGLVAIATSAAHSGYIITLPVTNPGLVSALAICHQTNPMHGKIDHHLQIRDHWLRRISVGSVRSARSTAGSVATSAVSRMAHVGEAIISVSVALTW